MTELFRRSSAALQQSRGGAALRKHYRSASVLPSELLSLWRIAAALGCGLGVEGSGDRRSVG